MLSFAATAERQAVFGIALEGVSAGGVGRSVGKPGGCLVCRLVVQVGFAEAGLRIVQSRRAMGVDPTFLDEGY